MKRIIGRSGTYILIKPLGKGGMGTVYHARWFANVGDVSKVVAVKLMHDLVLTESERERFLTEANMLAQLNHPGIVSIFDVDETKDGVPFLAMQWVDGINLRELLKKMKEAGRRLEPLVCCYILGELLKALEHAHDRTEAGIPAPIAHCDVKPENLIISSSGDVTLVDFGIARFAATSETMSRAIGTLHYMAPEQLFGKPCVKTDIWAAGAVGFELFHHPKRLFEGVPPELFRQTLLSGDLPELGSPDIEPWQVEMLRMMLCVKEEDRARAADLVELIIENAPFSQRGRQRLKDLYRQLVGSQRSGNTELLNLDLSEFGIAPSSFVGRQTPMPPPPADDFAAAFKSAAPHEPTMIEPRDERGDEDSPIVFRRDRARATPVSGKTVVDQAADRTSTGGPPRLDAILKSKVAQDPVAIAARPPALIAEQPPAMIAEQAPVAENPAEIVEPTEVLPPLFDERDAPPLATSRHPAPVNAPAPQQTLQNPGDLPGTVAEVPVAEAPSTPSFVIAPVIPLHERSTTKAVIGVLAVTVVGALCIVLALTLTKQPVNAENQPAPVARVEMDSLGPELTSGPVDDVEPDTDTTKGPIVEPERTEPKDPTPTVMDQAKEDEETQPQVVPPIEDDKPKPKKAAAPSMKVLFFIEGHPTAQIEIDGKIRDHNGMTVTTLRAGKKYPIQWRKNATDSWRSAGTLTLDPLESKDDYYEIHLHPRLVVNTRSKGSL